MNPVFIQVISADDQMPCLVNVNSIDTVTRTASTYCRLFITGHTKPLESLTEYEDVLSLIEEATSRPIAKM
ncbi:hypothetical protein SAMN06269250_5430 [Spirosoma fluviale]|uniref:Uncharacterized protein n=1 Tax=Spirosoma fluviale TaxID=1597977 RepID=A0A286GMA5_9BACT|nr:hypothetical protein SAMN06269250_5430 [Spirosoma fluviale]